MHIFSAFAMPASRLFYCQLHSLLLFVIGCLPASLPFATAQVDVSAVVVLSVSGCADVGITTVNCTFGTNVTVHTNTAMVSTLQPYPYIIIAGGGAQIYGVPFSTPSSNDSSSLTFTLSPFGYTPSLLAPLMLTLTLFDFQSRNSSAPFIGLSIAPIPPPNLTSICGCQGSGGATLNCSPNSTTLVLEGSGLQWLSGGDVQVSLSQGSSQRSANAGLQVVNDSYALFPFSQVFQYLLLPIHYNETLLALSFNLREWNYWTRTSSAYQTNALNVSFIPLPPPSVTAVSGGGGCVATRTSTNSTSLTQCIAAESTFTLSGHYLYDVTITVGGIPCISVTSSAISASCNLPLIPDFDPTLGYDVALSNSAGSLVLLALVWYRSGPMLTSMTNCVEIGLGLKQVRAGGRCQPGTAIILTGADFQADPALSIVFAITSDPSVNVTCKQPRFVNSSALACVLPTALEADLTRFLGQYVTLSVSFPSLSLSTNGISVSAFDWPDPPFITSVGGCGTSLSPLVVTQCSFEGELILTGINLNGTQISVYSSGPTPLGFMSFDCVVVPPTTATSITCRLPAIGTGLVPLVPGVAYTMFGYLTDSQGRMRRMNVFIITLTGDAPPSPSNSNSTGDAGSGSNYVSVIVGVVVSITVLVLVVSGLVRWRRGCVVLKALRGEGSRGVFGQSSMRSDSVDEVELR